MYRRDDRIVPSEREDPPSNRSSRRNSLMKKSKLLPSTYFRLSVTGNDLAYRQLETSAKRNESRNGIGLHRVAESLGSGWQLTLGMAPEFPTLLDDDEVCDFDSDIGKEGLIPPLSKSFSMQNLLDVNSELYKLRESRQNIRRTFSHSNFKT